MKLFFTGHQEKYAIEQTLFMLFPTERAEYGTENPGGENELELRLHEAAHYMSATALLRRDGKRFLRTCRITRPSEETDEVSKTRLRRRCLQRAFYRAAIDCLGQEPAWGMLSGVRPVKLPVKAMLSGASPVKARRTLLQDFRVSPNRADLAMDCAAAALHLKQSLLPTEISLYVGIPFCPTRCAYCSFISAAGNTAALIPPYLETLHEEVKAAGQAAREAGVSVRSVYIGGGTPTTLSAEALSALLAAIWNAFPLLPGTEFTVEAGRPDTITREKLEAIKTGGANRISVNPQTLSDEVLQAIGRRHRVSDFRTAYALVQETGFDSVNTDLIAGLPKDNLPGFQRSLEELLTLSPENITVHTLAMKRGSRLHEEGTALPSENEVAAMLDFAWPRLRACGYLPYYLYRQKFMSGGFENIGWCKPGKESTYNICMMEELHSVLSLGAGGVTKLIQYESGALRRLSNPKYPQEYIRDCARILTEKRQLQTFDAT